MLTKLLIILFTTCFYLLFTTQMSHLLRSLRMYVRENNRSRKHHLYSPTFLNCFSKITKRTASNLSLSPIKKHIAPNTQISPFNQAQSDVRIIFPLELEEKRYHVNFAESRGQTLKVNSLACVDPVLLRLDFRAQRCTDNCCTFVTSFFISVQSYSYSIR